MSATYSISALASELAITTRTIRFYEEQGLLEPERRGQERIYHERDRSALILVLRAKRLGFSLNECQALLALCTQPAGDDPAGLGARMEGIAALRSKLAEQREAIEQLDQRLTEAETKTRDRLETLRAPRRGSRPDEQQMTLFRFDQPDG
ncbi:MerR family transcriptional regulator [Halotalea alkalilenta]|uniref:MerR family transcriptional regulator n=1 Tax=Halotalea alkalilenta TaxID=376489 RepID=UPI0009DDBB4B|nr:MerR family transcriptional regulator [Halotalea alkalilenta]